MHSATTVPRGTMQCDGATVNRTPDGDPPSAAVRATRNAVRAPTFRTVTKRGESHPGRTAPKRTIRTSAPEVEEPPGVASSMWGTRGMATDTPWQPP